MSQNQFTDLAVLFLRLVLDIMFLTHSLILKLFVFTLPGTAQFFSSIGIPGWFAYVVCRTGDRILAGANTCLHLGGPLECKDGAFVRPWHGTRFDMSNSHRIHRPAPAKAQLMILPTRVDGKKLVYVWEKSS